jgi:hypothetical protein
MKVYARILYATFVITATLAPAAVHAATLGDDPKTWTGSASESIHDRQLPVRTLPWHPQPPLQSGPGWQDPLQPLPGMFVPKPQFLQRPT